MKKVKEMVMALTLLVGLGVTSCMGESSYTPQWGGAAEVINWMGATQFKDVNSMEKQLNRVSYSVMLYPQCCVRCSVCVMSLFMCSLKVTVRN